MGNRDGIRKGAYMIGGSYPAEQVSRRQVKSTPRKGDFMIGGSHPARDLDDLADRFPQFEGALRSVGPPPEAVALAKLTAEQRKIAERIADLKRKAEAFMKATGR